MTKNSIIATLTALTLAAQSGAVLARDANHSDDITVSAPREQIIGRSQHGFPVKLLTVTAEVNVGDLNLQSNPGWNELGQRVRTASRIACNLLDRESYIRSDSETSRCRSKATNEGMRAALAFRTDPRKVESLAFTIGQ